MGAAGRLADGSSGAAGIDITVLSFDGVTPPAFHKLALALLAIAAALLWRLSLVSRS
jgi:hypothetical protein